MFHVKPLTADHAKNAAAPECVSRAAALANQQAVASCQMYSSSSRTRRGFGLAPRMLFTTSPPE